MSKPKGMMIGGVDVQFPFKPYPSQLSMMSMIIKGLEQKKNCLLESPTGSGKTLALLCAALAWQEKQWKLKNDLKSQECKDPEASQENIYVPRIWFGTRTHKQIAQVISELKSTKYKNVKMTVLSSRKHSCIHPVNMESSHTSKIEGCQQLLQGTHPDDIGAYCKYKKDVHKIRNLPCGELDEAWDLEDLVEIGKRRGLCPYFGSRELIIGAKIIFCPYNYITDPMIRSQMSLMTKNEVIILDEEHNIEDSSRSSASFEFGEPELANAIDDFNKMIELEFRVDAMQAMYFLCSKIGSWLHIKQAELVEIEFETRSKVWSGGEFMQNLTEWGITEETLPILMKKFNEAIEKEEEDQFGDREDGAPAPSLNSGTKSLLEGLFFVIQNLYIMDNKYAQDYKIALMETKEFRRDKPKPNQAGWVSIHKRPMKRTLLTLYFWCLNPAVAFRQLSSSHCIVLTSGTLSPMSSFASELGVDFPITLEAPHVIPNKQVWVGSVGCGPTNLDLQATYQNVNSFPFQDEIALLIQNVCEVTPKGVLCFFTSYRLMEKMVDRWKNTGMWIKILQTKEIFAECHGKNSSEFDNLLSSFYRATSDTGALLLAVFRGKVSEGLDFSNDNARAVITVGIPYPNFKDRQVSLKKRYNDINLYRGLLTGSQWYEIQAYRALNQALGRCIRHINDWGALIMVDKRFCVNPNKYCSGLSKWIRNRNTVHSNFNSALTSLKEFCSDMQSDERFNTSTKSADHDHIVDKESKFQCNKTKQSSVKNLDKENLNKIKSRYFKKETYQRPQQQNIQSEVKPCNIQPVQNCCRETEPIQIKTEVVEEVKQSPIVDKLQKFKYCKLFENNASDDSIKLECKTPDDSKFHDVTVIPESPALRSPFIGDDDDDFSTSSTTKRKHRASDQKAHEQKAKKQKSCKKELNFDNETQPQTRKKSKKKAANFHVCHHKVSKLHNCDRSFALIEARFPNRSEKLKTCSFKGFVKEVSDTKLQLDCVWCSTDNLAYQFYNCSTCNETVGFQVRNLPNFDQDQLIVFNSFCSRS